VDVLLCDAIFSITPLGRKVYAFLPEHMSWPTIFSGVCVLRSLVFCVVFCRSLFVLISLDIVLSVIKLEMIWYWNLTFFRNFSWPI
jgi:hypothetical protein